MSLIMLLHDAGGTRVGSGLSSPPTPTAAGRLPPGSPSASLHLPNSSSASSSPLRYSSHAGGATTAAAGSPVPSLKHTTTTLAASGGSGGVARGVGGQFGAVALSPSPPTRGVMTNELTCRMRFLLIDSTVAPRSTENPGTCSAAV